MTTVSCGDAAITAGWPDLVDELDRWHSAGRVAGLWWRDDDAVATTPCLDRLLSLAGDAPLALAVIPADAEPGLAAALATMPQIAVLQHGWRHANHASVGKKSEFPAGRPHGEVAADLAAGRRRLAALFGTRALPVLVPPWNRFADEFLPLLTASGIVALSVMARPQRRSPTHGIAPLDVEVDLVAWHGGRGFIGEAAALGGIVAGLGARRRGVTDPDSARASSMTGILTHHLVMDDACAAFLRELRPLIERHPAARWASVDELLP